MNESKDAVSLEMAQMELQRFADAMDLDIDAEGLPDDERKGLEDAKRKFVRAVQCGTLIVDDEGRPVFTPRRSENKTPLVFHEPEGHTLLESDKAKASADVQKLYRVLGQVTKTTPARFADLKLADIQVCSAIVSLFMG